ncbi:hypothetical protein ACTG9Q_06905 [Actinokineospora sp. 24-640]
MTVFTGMVVNNSCPMRYYPCDNGEVTFVLGQGGDDFELTMGLESVSRFIRIAGEALAAEDQRRG